MEYKITDVSPKSGCFDYQGLKGWSIKTVFCLFYPTAAKDDRLAKKKCIGLKI